MQAGWVGGGVNIASISGLCGSTLHVAYGTSKAALIQLTRQHAVELGTKGISVNAVAPGPVNIDMAKFVNKEAIRSAYHDVIRVNRYGTVDEIAAAVCWRSGDETSYLNRQVLAADAGFEAAGGLPTPRREQASQPKAKCGHGAARLCPHPRPCSRRLTAHHDVEAEAVQRKRRA
jgi:NAD(P)-dependent dehydrogenase (short-subunit alcohol dehydrogenase family)